MLCGMLHKKPELEFLRMSFMAIKRLFWITLMRQGVPVRSLRCLYVLRLWTFLVGGTKHPVFPRGVETSRPPQHILKWIWDTRVKLGQRENWGARGPEGALENGRVLACADHTYSLLWPGSGHYQKGSSVLRKQWLVWGRFPIFNGCLIFNSRVFSCQSFFFFPSN